MIMQPNLCFRQHSGVDVQLAWVNLLCFDEAHHATKGHPYALLMKVVSG